jgi:hypothetical protein
MLDAEIDPVRMQPIVDLRHFIPEQIPFSADLNDSLKTEMDFIFFVEKHRGM